MNTDEIFEQHKCDKECLKSLTNAITKYGGSVECQYCYTVKELIKQAIETEKKQAVIEALGEVRSQLPTSTNNSSRYDFVKIDSCLEKKIKALKGE